MYHQACTCTIKDIEYGYVANKLNPTCPLHGKQPTATLTVTPCSECCKKDMEIERLTWNLEQAEAQIDNLNHEVKVLQNLLDGHGITKKG